MKPLEPIRVTHLFEPMLGHLLQLLRQLSEREWSLATPCAGWTVKDIALHLLGGEIGQLSRGRDNDTSSILPPGPDLVSRINAHNQLWVEASRGITFVRALPYTFRSIEAPENTVVGLIVTGEAGQNWFLLRKEAHWSLFTETPLSPSATVTIDQETAWKLFTKGIAKEDAMKKASIKGNQELAASIFEVVSIIA